MLAKMGQLQRLFMQQAAAADAWAMTKEGVEREKNVAPGSTAPEAAAGVCRRKRVKRGSGGRGSSPRQMLLIVFFNNLIFV